MPARDAEPWLLALRNTLRTSVGRAYRIYAVGKKTKVDIKFADGSRGSAKLDIPLVAAQARAIQDAVESLAALIQLITPLSMSATWMRVGPCGFWCHCGVRSPFKQLA